MSINEAFVIVDKIRTLKTLITNDGLTCQLESSLSVKCISNQ